MSGHKHVEDVPQAWDAEELPCLMARLGRLLDRHGPGGVVVVSREEYERRELSAYAGGWQDAVDEYLPQITAARWEGWLGRWPPLRVLDDPAEVIAFPTARQLSDSVDELFGPAGPGDGNRVSPGDLPGELSDAAEDISGSSGDVSGPSEDAPARRTEPASDAGSPSVSPSAPPESSSGGGVGVGAGRVEGPEYGRRPGAKAPHALAEPQSGPKTAARRTGEPAERPGPGRDPAVRPSLSPKNRRSKAPTIPRLTPAAARRPRPPGDGPEGTAG